jgi:clan AA aspartic protease (TIGR02281 family)
MVFDNQCSCGWSKGTALRQTLAITTSIFVAGAALWFVGNNFRTWFPDKDGANEHLVKGKDYLYQEKYDQAIQEFNEATNLNPNSAQAHKMLAKAFDESDQVHQALAEIGIAAKLAPYDLAINDKYVALLEDQDKLEEAVAPETRLLTLRPHDATLKREASWLYEQLGDKKKALQLMQDAVQEDQQSYKGWYNLAGLLDDMDRTPEGIAVLRQGLKVLPDSGDLYFELGQFLSSTDHPSDAIEPLKKAIALNPDDDEAAQLMQQITKAAGKPVYLVKLKKDGMSFYVDAIINEKIHTRLVLDSGATSVVVSNNIANKLGIDLHSAPAVHFASATSNAVGHEVTLKSIRLDDAKVGDIKAIVYDTTSQDGEEGLLGMSFLSHFKFTMDADHSQLWLSTR